MKHLIFILLGFFIWNSALSQTRTSNFQLPQWSTGDTLKAGTANDTTRANFSLNNGFARLDAILGARIDSTGRFIDILGAGTGNLIINSGSLGGTATRISLADSLYGTFNWQTTANLLVGGNATIGGYIATDSVQISSLWLSGQLDVGGNINSYADISTLNGGTIASDADVTANTDVRANETMTIGENVGGYLPANGSEVKMYVKGDKFIIAYNQGGTYKYRYLDLTSTNATWTYTTTEP